MSLSDWIKKILGILGKDRERQERINALGTKVQDSIERTDKLIMTLNGDANWIRGKHDEFKL